MNVSLDFILAGKGNIEKSKDASREINLNHEKLLCDCVLPGGLTVRCPDLILTQECVY